MSPSIRSKAFNRRDRKEKAAKVAEKGMVVSMIQFCDQLAGPGVMSTTLPL